MDYIEKMSEEYLLAWLNTDRAGEAIYELISRKIFELTKVGYILTALIIIAFISCTVAIIQNQSKTRKMLREMMEKKEEENKPRNEH